ncbi:MAG: ABC transporter ATP-binding protein, partial [Planctomycetes bacterium]|nr:ABC transporter ATP-binding protein [Planctomycetota bacterium]
EVRGLNTGFEMGGRIVPVIEDVDFDVRKGEFLGLIGESGSGKTVTGMSVLRLLPENTVTTAVKLDFQGTALLDLGEEQFRALRGNRLAMVFQDPTAAFNPAKRVGWHVRQVFERAASKSPEHAARARDWKPAAVSLLREVGIVHGEEVLAQYPHQLSGGMLQRALIALVLAFEPDLIVADEPTTNLDNIVERQILKLFRRLQQRLSSAFIFITHDMSIAASLCDRIAVMYAGRIVEVGDTRTIFKDPKHPYTKGLLATALALEGGHARLQEIPGELPHPGSWPQGCLFAARCAEARDDCRAARPAMRRIAGREVRCVLYGDGDE